MPPPPPQAAMSRAPVITDAMRKLLLSAARCLFPRSMRHPSNGVVGLQPAAPSPNHRGGAGPEPEIGNLR